MECLAHSCSISMNANVTLPALTWPGSVGCWHIELLAICASGSDQLNRSVSFTASQRHLWHQNMSSYCPVLFLATTGEESIPRMHAAFYGGGQYWRPPLGKASLHPGKPLYPYGHGKASWEHWQCHCYWQPSLPIPSDLDPTMFFPFSLPLLTIAGNLLYSHTPPHTGLPAPELWAEVAAADLQQQPKNGFQQYAYYQQLIYNTGSCPTGIKWVTGLGHKFQALVALWSKLFESMFNTTVEGMSWNPSEDAQSPLTMLTWTKKS